MKRSDALARPAMPSATSTHARPAARPTVRTTLDIPRDEHLELKRWATEAGVPASLLLLALIELGKGPSIRARATALATSMAAERATKRSVGQ